MITWALDHPKHGRIVVETGSDAEFLERYPDWPGEPKCDDDGNVVPNPEITENSSLLDRVKALKGRPPQRCQISVDGQARRRYANVPKGRVAMTQGKIETLAPSVSVGMNNAGFLKIELDPFGEIQEIQYRDKDSAVLFPPPAGTKAARRSRRMDDSAFLRVFYPMMCGLGKSGWALIALFLPPLIGKLIPDIPLPDWQLPHIDVSYVPVPVPHVPYIPLPAVTVDIPTIHVPGWVKWLAEYQKVWVPLVVAVVAAVLTVRNRKKSAENKRRWNQGD